MAGNRRAHAPLLGRHVENSTRAQDLVAALTLWRNLFKDLPGESVDVIFGFSRAATVRHSHQMLAKMCGWNEPEKQAHQHVHIQVDAALIAQLRTGYTELARQACERAA